MRAVAVACFVACFVAAAGCVDDNEDVPVGVPAEATNAICNLDGHAIPALCDWVVGDAVVVGTIVDVRYPTAPCLVHEPQRSSQTVAREVPDDAIHGDRGVEFDLAVDSVLFGEAADVVTVRVPRSTVLSWEPAVVDLDYDSVTRSRVPHWERGPADAAFDSEGQLAVGVRLGVQLVPIPGERWFVKLADFIGVDEDGRLFVQHEQANLTCTSALPAELEGVTVDDAAVLAACPARSAALFDAGEESEAWGYASCDVPTVRSP